MSELLNYLKGLKCLRINTPHTPDLNVTIALIKGVAIEFCCGAGKILDNQICFLTSLQPDKVYLRSIGNNKGVAIMILSYQYYELHYLVLPMSPSLIIATPPSISPNRKTSS